MKRFEKWIVLVVVMGLPVLCWADGIEDDIKQGLSLYQKGQYSQAVQSLNDAAAQIQQKQTERLKAIFPEPLPGWTAKEASSDFATMAMMGGGITANRRYSEEKTGQTVTIDIVTNAPMLQGILMYINNPYLASQTGVKPIKIKGHPGIKNVKDGEISLVVQNQMLVQVKGNNLKDDKVLQFYADKIDYVALEKFLSN